MSYVGRRALAGVYGAASGIVDRWQQVDNESGNQKNDVGTTARNSIATGKRLSLSRRIPRVLSPESLQRGVVAAKNVAFSFSNVGYRLRKRTPRSQPAFTIATVLPHTPGAPGRCVPRLGMVVSDPQPAIRQCLAVC